MKDISINVIRFGADRTGQNDSTAAIQAAIDYAESQVMTSGSGHKRAPSVYFPDGLYKAAGLYAQGNLNIFGDSAILQLNDNSKWILYVAATNSFQQIRVEGLTFTMSETVRARYADAGFPTNGENGDNTPNYDDEEAKVIITNTIGDFTDGSQCGLVVNSSNVSVVNCSFDDMGVGILHASAEFNANLNLSGQVYGGRVTGCEFRRNIYACAGIDYSNVSYVGNLSISENYFSTNHKADFCYNQINGGRFTLSSNTHDTKGMLGIFSNSEVLVSMIHGEVDPLPSGLVEVNLGDLTSSTSNPYGNDSSQVKPVAQNADDIRFDWDIWGNRITFIDSKGSAVKTRNYSEVYRVNDNNNEIAQYVELDSTSGFYPLQSGGFSNEGATAGYLNSNGNFVPSAPVNIGRGLSGNSDGQVFICPHPKHSINYSQALNDASYPALDHPNAVSISGAGSAETVVGTNGPFLSCLELTIGDEQSATFSTAADSGFSGKTTGFRVSVIEVQATEADTIVQWDGLNVHGRQFEIQPEYGRLTFFGVIDIEKTIASSGSMNGVVRLRNQSGAARTVQVANLQVLYFENYQQVVEFYKGATFFAQNTDDLIPTRPGVIRSSADWSSTQTQATIGYLPANYRIDSIRWKPSGTDTQNVSFGYQGNATYFEADTGASAHTDDKWNDVTLDKFSDPELTGSTQIKIDPLANATMSVITEVHFSI